MQYHSISVFILGFLSLLSLPVLGVISPYQCFDGGIIDNDECNQYNMVNISPFAGKFVRIYTDSTKTQCLQDTGETNGYSAVGGVGSIMSKVASGPCDPNKMYYVLPDGNTEGNTGLFALWGYDYSSKSPKGPLMTDGTHPLPQVSGAVSLLANQMYLWGDSRIPYFTWSEIYSQDTSKRSSQYGDNAKWFKWFPQYYYDGPGGGNNLDPSKYMSVYLWDYATDKNTLTGRITQTFYDRHYGDKPKSNQVTGEIGKLSVCRASSCNAIQTYYTISDGKSWSDSGAGSWCNQPCGEGNKYIRPWIDVNGKYRCPYTEYKGDNGCKDKGNCQQLEFQYLTGWVSNCYSGSAATNGSVPINAGILTPKSNSQEDRNKVGDYSTYMEIEEVPLRYHPLYLSNMLDVCSPSNLQKAGWEDVSTCPLQSVAGIGGNDLNGNVELVVPSTLQGMPFLSKLRVFANPRMGFASMRMDFYDPSGTKYNSVSTGDPSNMASAKAYECNLDPLEIITDLYLLPKLVGNINRRTILGLKWITDQGKTCSIPSEWQNDESVWQSALKISGDDLGGGIPVGLVFNRVQDEDPLDPFSATRNYIGKFGLVFYRQILSGLSEGKYSDPELVSMAQQLNSTTSIQDVSAPQTCQYTGSSNYMNTCVYTSTTSLTVNNTYTNSYSYSSSNSFIQTLKSSKSKDYKANAGFEISLWKFSSGAESSWEWVKAAEMEGSTTVTGDTTRQASQVTDIQTNDQVQCQVVVTATPETPSITVTFVKSTGRYTVPWSGNYSLLLEGGAKFDFVAAGEYVGSTGSACWFTVEEVKGPPAPPLVCPKGDKDCFCSTHYPGLYPDYQANCQYYYLCYTTSSKRRKCPDGQLFDATTETCEPADQVDCVDPSVPQPPVSNPPPPPLAESPPPPAPVAESPPPPAPVEESPPPPAPVEESSPPPAPVEESSPPPAPVEESSPDAANQTNRKLMASMRKCKSERSSCFSKKRQKYQCECPEGLTCRAMLTYKYGEIFRCQEPLTSGQIFKADIVKLKNAKCKSFVTMDLRWWPNLKALAERCNISEYCLYTANTDLLKKYSLPDGTFLPGMKGRKLNIGCFHRSNY